MTQRRLSPQGVGLAVMTALCSGIGVALLKGALGAEIDVLAVLAGLAVYGAGIVLGIVLIGKYPLSVAYPVVVGLSLAVLAVISATVLGEGVGFGKLAGTVLIVVGVALLVRPTHS